MNSSQEDCQKNNLINKKISETSQTSKHSINKQNQTKLMVSTNNNVVNDGETKKNKDDEQKFEVANYNITISSKRRQRNAYKDRHSREQPRISEAELKIYFDEMRQLAINQVEKQVIQEGKLISVKAIEAKFPNFQRLQHQEQENIFKKDMYAYCLYKAIQAAIQLAQEEVGINDTEDGSYVKFQSSGQQPQTSKAELKLKFDKMRQLAINQVEKQVIQEGKLISVKAIEAKFPNFQRLQHQEQENIFKKDMYAYCLYKAIQAAIQLAQEEVGINDTEDGSYVKFQSSGQQPQTSKAELKLKFDKMRQLAINQVEKQVVQEGKLISVKAIEAKFPNFQRLQHQEQENIFKKDMYAYCLYKAIQAAIQLAQEEALSHISVS